MSAAEEVPRVRQTVLDTTDVRGLAEFYRVLLGYDYRPGDETPDAGEPDPADWLVLRGGDGAPPLAFQQVEVLTPSSWPDNEPVPQQLHLDMTVASKDALEEQHQRVLRLGGRMLFDRSDDEEEPLRVYADPAGHPFCIFVG
ncbi:VOC family protein [Allobranchiibius sp. CTAmp26]|uniref:VOC family protein n=1 Tax=Allobranchiibius sp. CTAmp26 TaxID=2815214 RepID=UPI001AA1074A|nr:VOC family protein [Allobranchiibius sp. CTAmp26]MBO1754652.1 VOC family protein [Allobranchiibius sp. CTAmp26]